MCFIAAIDLLRNLINSLAPGKFAWIIDRFFKQILVIDGWGISCQIALIWISLDFTDDQSTLFQVIAWCRQATSHYLSQCWPRSVSPHGVTRPQWFYIMLLVHWWLKRFVRRLKETCIKLLLKPWIYPVQTDYTHHDVKRYIEKSQSRYIHTRIAPIWKYICLSIFVCICQFHVIPKGNVTDSVVISWHGLIWFHCM